MVQDGFGLAILLGAGALLLRPRDFPLFARAAGRLVGLTVRSMRASRDAAERAIQESADIDHLQNPQMIVMRENLKQSLDKFDSLASTVRRDMAEVPLSPASLLRKGWRSWEEKANRSARSTNDVIKRDTHGSNLAAVPNSTQVTSDTHSVARVASNLHVDRQSVTHVRDGGQFISGADLVSRAVEEAALARQERQIFGTTKDCN